MTEHALDIATVKERLAERGGYDRQQPHDEDEVSVLVIFEKWPAA